MKIHPPNEPEQAQKEISISETKVQDCPKCGCQTFVQAFKWGKLSPVHPANDSGKEMMIAFPTWACSQCGVEPQPETE